MVAWDFASFLLVIGIILIIGRITSFYEKEPECDWHTWDANNVCKQCGRTPYDGS